MKWLNPTHIFIGFILVLTSQPALSVWFEASGQAVIHNGDKKVARQLATQEAIKQALLFAGASVKSVQHMANGLLSEDRLEISTSGEVASVELIDEIFHGDIITVSVRADIFPQKTQCDASEYKKGIVTTWYKINNRQQAAVGNMYDFGKVFAQRLQQQSLQHSKHATINNLEQYYLTPSDQHNVTHALKLATKTRNQYVLLGQISDFAVNTQASPSLAFWQADKVSRNLSLAVSLYDGTSGELIFQENLNTSAPWEFDLHSMVNSNGSNLWQSSFGQAANKLIQQINQKIDDTVSCLPTYGRVLAIGSEQLTVNIGKQNGVKVGDILTLFQVTNVYNDSNTPFKHYQLHPEKVRVSHVFPETALVVSENGIPLANIQPNDFVARQ